VAVVVNLISSFVCVFSFMLPLSCLELVETGCDVEIDDEQPEHGDVPEHSEQLDDAHSPDEPANTEDISDHLDSSSEENTPGLQLMSLTTACMSRLKTYVHITHCFC
jgi:hypothetical protein